MTTKTRRKKRPAPNPNAAKRGRKGAAAELPADKRAEGYRSIAEAAREIGVAASTVYDWVRREVLPEVPNDKRPAVLRTRSGGNVWVLLDAVRAMRPAPVPEPAA
jgi:hypothetical protein